MERRENLQKMKEKRERPQPLYMDGDIAIIDLKECDSFGSQEGVRLDYFLFLSCTSGSLWFNINAHEKELKAYQILLCRPNDLLSNFEFSTDCQGIVMCVSREAITDNIRLDNLFWKSKLPLNENPILHLSEEEIQLLSRYGQLIDYRLRMKGRPYSKAVLTDVRYQLKYSQKSIKEIADYLDFPNISFFGKFVRRHVGCSPKEYRRRLQAEQ